MGGSAQGFLTYGVSLYPCGIQDGTGNGGGSGLVIVVVNSSTCHGNQKSLIPTQRAVVHQMVRWVSLRVSIGQPHLTTKLLAPRSNNECD